MVNRPIWENLIEQQWKKRSILWLSGVRRVGKTSLCQNLADIHYYDCELPSTRRMLEDPELFFKNKNGQKIALDEIHRLAAPSEILKIAADHFPQIKIIATGSSTLEASHKFRDTLTGRKTEIWLTPLLREECTLFGDPELTHRLLFGGLPPFFMEQIFPHREFLEWIDSYWAKDIQELFRVEKRYAFQKFMELLFLQSGGIFEASRFTSACEVSRTSISNYLSILEASHVAHIIRPFNTHRPNEIITAPKVYAFDTGFVCYAKAWEKLDEEANGLLWEHCVLNELQGRLQTREIFYWRDKQQHEIDFIFIKNRQHTAPIAIECKWRAEKFDPKNLKIFRKRYPQGLNFLVAENINEPFEKNVAGLTIRFSNVQDLIQMLSKPFK